MSNFSSYPSYKNSIIEWLYGAKIPAHWREAPLSFLARMRSGDAITAESIEEDGPYRVYGANGLRGFGELFNTSGERVLIGRVGALCGNIHLVRGEFFASEHALVTTPLASANIRWLSKVLEVMNLGQYSRAAAQPVISAEVLSKLKLPTPPLSEQKAIADFLDHETAEIDTFIADQEELVELLKERRAATITQAVTKGLNLTVQMKDSGVPWIGKVPQHWVVDKGTRIGKVFGSEMVKEEDINEVAGTQFLKVSSLSVEGFSLQPTRWFVDRYATAPVTDFIVFPKRGAAIFTNKVNIVKEPALLDPNLMGWKPYKGCDSKFFAYVLQLVKLEEIADVSTVPQINTKHIASLRLPKPSLVEQQDIVDYLDYETSEIDAAIADAKEAIELSKERRAALISAAVTGKIDVRNHTTAELGAA